MVSSLPLVKHRLKLSTLCCFFLVLCFNRVTAQNLPIRFDNYTVEDGLSMGTISAFEQDHNGFMWIATAEGLHKFDGKRFTIFKHIDGDQNSLADSYITALLNVGDQLYIGNNSGTIDVLNVDDESIKRIKIQELDSEFDSPIIGLYLLHQQLIITTNSGGVFSYHTAHKTLRRIHFKGFNPNEYTQFYFTEDFKILCNGPSLYTFSENDTVSLATLNSAITSIAQFNNRIYLGTNNGLYTFEFATNRLEKVTLPPRRRLINRITYLISSPIELWIGTKGGILTLDNNGLFNHYTANETDPKSLISNNITALFADNQENKWVGTIAGISKYAPTARHFGLLSEFWYTGNQYNNNVYNVYEDQEGTVWLGTLSGGLVKLKNNTIDKIYPEVKDGNYASRSVRCIYQDSKGTYWIGTRDEGLFTFNPESHKFQLVANQQNGKLNNNVIRSIKEDADGVLWIGTQLGLYRKEGSDFEFYRADNNVNNNVIYQIEESPSNEHLILASFRGGLQFFDKETKTFETIHHIKGDSTSLSNNNVMSLAWVNSDTLLVGTYGGGLNIYDLKTKKFKHFTEKEGLANNAVYGIVYNGNGNCWLSTNSGLVKYNLYTETFQNFGTQHYLQSKEFNEGAFLKSSFGTIYFGGINGLNFFKPEKQNFTSEPPNLLITNVEATVTSRKNGVYHLSHINSRLEIDFAALYYANPQGVIYEYKLDNFDNTWIKTKSNGTVYPRLSPGSYTFYVRATNDLGTWKAAPISLQIYVAPPFWQRWWFIGVCILTLILVLLIIVRVRTKAVERSYKLQLVDSELRALRSQMNPHFIFNSLNSIQYYILQKEPKQAYVYLSKFANLMRKILQNSRLKYISIKEEVDWLNLYLELEKMRMDDNLNFSIHLNDLTEPENIFIPTMLLQPFVENSIVHGLLPKEGDRVLSINITLKNNTVYCSIEDNGIGRIASEQINKKRNKHESAGMDLTRKRLEILGKGKNNYAMEISDLMEDGKPSGTLVKLEIPVIKEDELH